MYNKSERVDAGASTLKPLTPHSDRWACRRTRIIRGSATNASNENACAHGAPDPPLTQANNRRRAAPADRCGPKAP